MLPSFLEIGPLVPEKIFEVFLPKSMISDRIYDDIPHPNEKFELVIPILMFFFF